MEELSGTRGGGSVRGGLLKMKGVKKANKRLSMESNKK